MKYNILDENNNIINTILADQTFVEEKYPNRYQLIEEPIIESPKNSTLTKLQFNNRFTFDELVAIEVATETNPGVRVFKNQLFLTDYVDLTNTNTIDGINYLVSQSLITQERADIILTY
jgi:hypothetical protein